MKLMHCAVLLFLTAQAAASQEKPAQPPAEQEPAAETNINERYTVESVELSGERKVRLTKSLRDDLDRMVGRKFSQKTLDDLVERIRKHLDGRRVDQKISRGDQPEHIKIVLEVHKRLELLDIALSKLVYHSKSAWSAKLVGDFEFDYPASVILGLVSNADDLLERHAGIVAGFQSKRVVTDRVRLRFLFENYHQQWNRTTLRALEQAPEIPGIYRTRKSFAPTLTVALAQPLELSFGTSFQFLQTQFPTARTEAANAAVGELRYHQGFRDPRDNRHDLEAAYKLRAATRSFESDFVYARHQFEFGYKLGARRQSVLSVFTGGRISGRAPLFERFTLGDSATLRGWSKFDVAPLGATRMAHHSLEYRYKGFQVFYDAGAVWDRDQRVVVKHATGFGFREDKGAAAMLMPGFFATVGFPIKSGRMAPMLMIGINF